MRWPGILWLWGANAVMFTRIPRPPANRGLSWWALSVLIGSRKCDMDSSRRALHGRCPWAHFRLFQGLYVVLKARSIGCYPELQGYIHATLSVSVNICAAMPLERRDHGYTLPICNMLYDLCHMLHDICFGTYAICHMLYALWYLIYAVCCNALCHLQYTIC